MKYKGSVNRLFTGIFGMVLGLVLVTVSASVLLGILSKIVGIFLIIVNIPEAVAGAMQISNAVGRVSFVSAVIGIVIGIVMVFLTSTALNVGMVIAGIWFLVLPIFDIITSPYKTEQFKAELPKIIIGIMLIVLGPLQAFDVIFTVIGWVIVVFSLLMIIAAVVETLKNN